MAAEQQQSGFRLRLPWLQSGSTSTRAPPRRSNSTTTSESPVAASPAPESLNSNQSTTAQRPPFRPPGRAQSQVSRTEPNPSSPSRSAPQSWPMSPSSSPNRKAPQTPSRRAARDTSSSSSLSKELENQSSKSTETESETPKSEELQPKKEEAKLQQPEMRIQPSKESEITTNNQQSKPSTDSNEARKKDQEVKEIQTTKEKDSEEETMQTSNSDGQQTKSITSSHLWNKTTVADSHKKLAVSEEQLVPLHKDLVQKTSVGGKKQPMEERPVNVITLAGDNRGASMQLGFGSSKKEQPIHIHRAYKSNPDESVDATTTDAEGSSGGRKSEDQEVKAYVNCNIQSINNSLLLSSSITERNPGVNLEIPRIPKEPVKSNDKIVTRKAEFNTTPAHKLTYDPTIRRRCLKGLFMESSDSDPDNPGKPRRHGCQAGCKEKSIENQADINLSR